MCSFSMLRIFPTSKSQRRRCQSWIEYFDHLFIRIAEKQTTNNINIYRIHKWATLVASPVTRNETKVTRPGVFHTSIVIHWPITIAAYYFGYVRLWSLLLLLFWFNIYIFVELTLNVLSLRRHRVCATTLFSCILLLLSSIDLVAQPIATKTGRRSTIEHPNAVIVMSASQPCVLIRLMVNISPLKSSSLSIEALLFRLRRRLRMRKWLFEVRMVKKQAEAYDEHRRFILGRTHRITKDERGMKIEKDKTKKTY